MLWQTRLAEREPASYRRVVRFNRLLERHVAFLLVISATSFVNCGLYDPWQIRLSAESWEVLDGDEIRLHYHEDDFLLSDAAVAEAYLASGHAWHSYLNGRFGPKIGAIDVYQFRDEDHWREVLGSFQDRGGAASPFNPLSGRAQIFLLEYETLGHEMIHVMTAEVGQPAPALLHEGLAVAYGGSPDYSQGGNWSIPDGTNGHLDGSPVHDCASGWAGGDYMPSTVGSYWQKLTVNETAFYCLVGSFTKYLIDSYGLEKYMEVFKSAGRSALLGTSVDQAMNDILGKSLADLERDWLNAI